MNTRTVESGRMESSGGRPVIFVSYSHRDRRIKERLVEHIAVLGETDFELWDDAEIRTGTDWRRTIDEGLERADAGVLLISTSFLTSNFIKSVELPKLLAKDLYPVLIGYCPWQSVEWLTKLQMLTDNGKPLGTRGQKLDRALVKVAQELAGLFGARPVPDAEPRLAVGPPPSAPTAGPTVPSPVHVEPVGYLGIVLQRDTTTGPVLNLMCRLVNDGGQPATIERLEATLTDPHRSSFRLRWNLFYEGTNVMRKVADAHPVSLPPTSSGTMGVQFVGPPSVTHYRWSEGPHAFELRGWLADGKDRTAPDVVTPCEITVSAEAARGLTYWGAAGPAQWKALGDPDNAVAVVVALSRVPAAPTSVV
jgi:hypothetical protein